MSCTAFAYTTEQIWNGATNQTRSPEAKSVDERNGQIILENNKVTMPDAKKGFSLPHKR